MAHIHIREVDDGLLRALKLRAFEDGTTLKDWVVEVLSKAVKRGDGVRGEPANENAGPCEPLKISKPHAREGAVAPPETQSTEDEPVVAAARKILGLSKSDPEKVPGVKRGKHFTDTWGPK